jgi:hypothetical protein
MSSDWASAKETLRNSKEFQRRRGEGERGRRGDAERGGRGDEGRRLRRWSSALVHVIWRDKKEPPHLVARYTVAPVGAAGSSADERDALVHRIPEGEPNQNAVCGSGQHTPPYSFRYCPVQRVTLRVMLAALADAGARRRVRTTCPVPTTFQSVSTCTGRLAPIHRRSLQRLARLDWLGWRGMRIRHKLTTGSICQSWG